VVNGSFLPDRYRYPERIARGGMGEVYRAEDLDLARLVAIKVLADRFAENDAIRGRFTREALAVARLSNAPNTVTIFDVGETDEGRPFIVMEYLSGGSLEDRLRQGPVPTEDALEWLGQAAVALDAAHAGGIVHRDVKPGNLLLDADGCVHVADFGVARATGLDSLTLAGTVLGTAGYLSPEQARGEQAGPASDRYALGVLAFELLTGERPYQRDTTAAEAAAHVHEAVPSIHDRNPALPAALDRCFRRALAKDPARRFESNTAFVTALRDALTEPERPVAVAAAAAPPVRRHSRHPWRIPAIVGLLAAAALVGALLAPALVDGGEESSGATTAPVTTQAPATDPEPPAPPPPPPPPPPPTPTPPPTPATESPVALTDRATELMRQGRFGEALPIAQQALAALQGSGQLYEAYANYDVGRSLIELGRCEEGVPYIEASRRIQGSRAEFREALKLCGGKKKAKKAKDD
jgi:Protein kinase domain